MKILPFQIDVVQLASDISFTSNLDHNNLANVGTYTHANIDSHINDTTLHFTTLDGLSDITYTRPLQTRDILQYNSAGNFWEPIDKFHYIDITISGIGSPQVSGILPSGWSATYNSTGNVTITHNLGITSFGYALTGEYQGAGIVINPTNITVNSIDLIATDTLNNLVDCRIMGMLIRH